MKFLFLLFAAIVSTVTVSAKHISPVGITYAYLYGNLRVGLNCFSNDCGRYPTTAEGFDALINCPTNISNGQWHGPYLDPPKIPKYPWKGDFVYRCPGIHNANSYDIYSCGFDGISKSGGDDLDDINNWDHPSPHGGNDFYFNRFQMITGSIGFQLLLLSLQVIPFLFSVRLLALTFSQKVRTSIIQHPIAHIIWLLMSLAAICLLLAFMPRAYS